ncbi:MAG: undecaprenyldiphospho-muramoylpentapeptide beta-N-acetylglucosaminyltransferase [Alphaproteobacteria bacterium]|nr:undecaprenyldiphospho-muramoylpentapeptide beta-N-acetylglucosaminyltransferase [Alphaproteobacteria bacterium]
MSKLKKSIVLTTGGTGGHVFPAQALAQELNVQGYKVFFFTDARGHQFKLPNVSLVKISASQLSGPLHKKMQGGVKLIVGTFAALYQLKRIKPAAVVGFGGYASFPTMMAAIALGIPTIVHQADAFFGRANHFLASLVTRIATSFPYVENIPKSCRHKVMYTGLPVRPEIKHELYILPKENETFQILITGGSQGAKIFGEVLPQAISLLKPSLQRRLCIHQQGRPEYLGLINALYQKTRAQVVLSRFFQSMGEEYKKAHLVISRAGASSVTEAAVVGRPALFVPYPYAMDDHQFYNAQQAVNVQGGWLMREKEFTPESVALYISSLMASPKKLEDAALNARKLAAPDAALRLAHLVKMITV